MSFIRGEAESAVSIQPGEERLTHLTCMSSTQWERMKKGELDPSRDVTEQEGTSISNH